MAATKVASLLVAAIVLCGMASPAFACRRPLNAPPRPVVTADDMDAIYAREAQVVAFGVVTDRTEEAARIRIDGGGRGETPEEVRLPDEILVTCYAPVLRTLPETLAVGDEVILLRGDIPFAFGFVEQLGTSRGQRLRALASIPDTQ